ncbi:hypothetical protein B0T18DRAFT_418664 [Schizothecium vesticola]|uniref:DUF2470 domain-containing protein n=1 Tax=Schizothecium vesticola TaxID=314040 RepID=A0AA40JZS9_9PEZI|nr:hypothetical protein B0T18DRAFT_418664 [Schizothecium vesticola]
MADPIPPASKLHTITHMNADHRLDLAHILARHLASPAPLDPSTVSLSDISLTTLTITTTAPAATHHIPFTPPLASWNDRRARLIEMSLAARPAVVSRYLPPRGFDVVVFLGVLTYYSCYVLLRLGVFDDGGVAAGWLGWSPFPGGAEGFRWLVGTIAVPVLGIHVGEMWWFDRTRAGKYGVRRGSGVWWGWMGSVFFEGYPAFARFDGEVGRVKAGGDKGGKKE